ncbi:MAG: hypothetical protein HND44_16385 [Chloroflexi bacterium]|nr:hypothetical protein [Ardenticatenaceae bacterium]MBL1130037.1 hypothetical protein [Chloroflexota bacterium]NOG36124.1 hypothetical protein [Chloroflexota bacterium]
MEDDIIGEISQIETIAQGSGVHIRNHLNKRYGRGRWLKKKGVALVRDGYGHPRLAEIHWFEAHGIGKKDFKRKRWLEE